MTIVHSTGTCDYCSQSQVPVEDKTDGGVCEEVSNTHAVALKLQIYPNFFYFFYVELL